MYIPTIIVKGKMDDDVRACNIVRLPGVQEGQQSACLGCERPGIQSPAWTVSAVTVLAAGLWLSLVAQA